MKWKFPIEICGLSKIVIDGVLYVRDTDRNWIRTTDNKTVKDNHMWSRIKRLMKKQKYIEEQVVLSNGHKVFAGEWADTYRAWTNLESLNIEKINYD